jgi:hypothetical protein
MPANFGFSQTGRMVGTACDELSRVVADPTSETPKFNLTPETIVFELFKELN